MIVGALPAIEDCDDCADFILCLSCGAGHAFGEAIAPKLPQAHRRSERSTYRFWMDEPGNDVQWYFSDNDGVLAVQYGEPLSRWACFGRELSCAPGAMAPNSRMSASAACAPGSITSRLWEMAEFNSAPYFPIDLKKGNPERPVHARPARRRAQARRQGDRAACWKSLRAPPSRGTLTRAQGRSYEHTLRASRSLELSGRGPHVVGQGQLRYAFPRAATTRALHPRPRPEGAGEARGRRQFQPAPARRSGPSRRARTGSASSTTTRCAAFHLAPLPPIDGNEWGYQETVVHLRWRKPDVTDGRTIWERPFIPAMAARPIGAVP